ncbi:FRG domain-containing protein [Pimelobacter simplex]|uniref:FRG domain-containing protein n=1 Tax=Nocardioides simplex TaxID=2045 RepID=UPI0019337766|nr:FRG domain-containing protein [Pimelobacter simplex]
MKELTAATRAELEHQCAELAAGNPGLQLYFRGQVHNHPPQPSELRTPSEAAGRIRVRYQRDLWKKAVLAAAPPSAASHRVDEIAASCLLQHYGFRSWFIDVTSDLNIALWFATRRFRQVNGLHFIPAHGPNETHVDHPLGAINTLDLPIAHYDRAEAPGHIFVYAVEPSSPLFVDLQHHAPESAERVRRQQGAGLFPTTDHDYSGIQIAHIDLAPGMAADVKKLRSASGELLTTKYLFPGPDDDPMYALLLQLPRVAEPGDDQGDHHLQVAVDAFGVPLYNSPSMTDHIPSLLKRAVRGTTTRCLTCMGFTDSTVELPITGPGGAPRDIFKPAHLREGNDAAETDRLADRALARALSPDAASPSPDLAAWPGKRLFLRSHVLRDVTPFLVYTDPYPLMRGYVLEQSADGALRFRLVQEFQDGALLVYPDLEDPGLQVNGALGQDLATLQRHECSGGTDKRWCGFCELVAIAQHAPWLHSYLEGVATEEAFIQRNSGGHYALYWADPDGVDPLGEPWSTSPN